MKRTLSALIAIVLLLVACSNGNALPSYLTTEDNAPLAVRSAAVSVEVNNNIVTTSVVQKIQNAGETELPCTISIALPKDARLNSFSATIDGRTYVGVVKTNEEAIREYNEADEIEEVAGMAFEEDGRINLQFTKIMPGVEFIFRFSYFEEAPYSEGLFSYTFGKEYSNEELPPIEEYSFDIAFNCTVSITSVQSGSHTIQGGVEGIRGRFAVLNPRETNKAFNMTWSLDLKPGEPVVMVKTSEDGDPYFSLICLPPDDGDFPQGRAVVLVMDKSGSMDGAPYDMAVKAGSEFVSRLKETDIVNLMFFDTSLHYCGPFPYKANARGIAATQEFISRNSAGGGTRFLQPLLDTMETLKLAEGRIPSIVLLTDGQDNVDRAKAFYDAIMAAGGFTTPIYTLAFGDGVDEPLLRCLSENSGATMGKIIAPADIPITLEEMSRRFDNLVAMDFNINADEGAVSEYFPRRTARMYRDVLISLAGRVGSGSNTITFTATTPKGEWKRTVAINGGEKQVNCSVLDAYWAAKKMRSLLDTIEIFGETEELKKEVIELSIRYMISSPYTRYVFTYLDEVVQFEALRSYGMRWGGGSARTSAKRGGNDMVYPLVDSDLIARDRSGNALPDQDIAHGLILAMRRDGDVQMLTYAYRSAQYVSYAIMENRLSKDLLTLSAYAWGLERLGQESGNRMVLKEVLKALASLDAKAAMEGKSDEYVAMTAYFVALLAKSSSDWARNALPLFKAAIEERTKLDFSVNPVGCEYDSALMWVEWFPLIMLVHDTYGITLPEDRILTPLKSIAFNPTQRHAWGSTDYFYRYTVKNLMRSGLLPDDIKGKADKARQFGFLSTETSNLVSLLAEVLRTRHGEVFEY